MTAFIGTVWVQTIVAISFFALFNAQCYARDMKFLGAVGWDAAGGNQIPLTSNDSVSASRGLTLKIGLEMPNNEAKTFVTQFFLGYKTSHGVFEELGESFSDFLASAFGLSDHRYAQFKRYPIEVIEQYQFPERFRVGAGITYYLNPTVVCVETQSGGCSSISSIDFNNALGVLIQFSYAWKTVELGVRYTFIDYKNAGQRYDGSEAGLFVGFGF